MKVNITKSDDGRALLSCIKTFFVNLPISRIERAFRQGNILVNGKKVKDKKLVMREADVLEIIGVDLETRTTTNKANKISFSIIFEDENVLILNKPCGISMHGDDNSLDNQVLKYLKSSNDNLFIPASIGRLDKVTSGLVIYAKNYQAQQELWNKHAYFKKIYQFKSDLSESMELRVKLRHDEGAQKEVVSDEGKEAITVFEIENDIKKATILTGRKHQIRASLAHLGYPIYGDRKYGGKSASRVFLHAYEITFSLLEGNLAYLNGKKFICETGWN